MDDPGLIAVYTTLDSLDVARTMASVLVEQRLVACAQISSIESIYRWDGRLQCEPEFRLMFKTVRRRYAEVEAAIKALHPYELPAVFAVPVVAAAADYGDWVHSTLQSPRGDQDGGG